MKPDTGIVSSARDPRGRATQIRLFDLRSPVMRTFHLSWLAFFVCFVAWFGVAPLMAIVRADLHLTPPEIGNILIASVAMTVIARIVIGWLGDRFGPRRTYTALLLLGSLPVMLIGLAHSYESFLLFRLAIGVIGASFVLSQQHTSLLFAPRVVGTANAMTAGWGNLGGGVTQWVMPALVGALMAFGTDKFLSWRYAMVLPGLAMVVVGLLYYRFTVDTPNGSSFQPARGAYAFRRAAGDFRVWLLFILYGGCFGIEITMDNVAALYFRDSFHVSLLLAGVLAAATGMMNLFARGLGGWFGDRAGNAWGLRARTSLLGAGLLLEGLALAAFAHSSSLQTAMPAYLLFGLFVCMACGLTYAVVPFLQPDALGSVSGIVGAGGNFGAVVAGFLFRSHGMTAPHALAIIGLTVAAMSPLTFLVGARDTAPVTAGYAAGAEPVAASLAEAGD